MGIGPVKTQISAEHGLCVQGGDEQFETVFPGLLIITRQAARGAVAAVRCFARTLYFYTGSAKGGSKHRPGAKKRPDMEALTSLSAIGTLEGQQVSRWTVGRYSESTLKDEEAWKFELTALATLSFWAFSLLSPDCGPASLRSNLGMAILPAPAPAPAESEGLLCMDAAGDELGRRRRRLRGAKVGDVREESLLRRWGVEDEAARDAAGDAGLRHGAAEPFLDRWLANRPGGFVSTRGRLSTSQAGKRAG